MDKNLEELMQVNVIGENTILSELIQDIIPIKEKRFTDLELEANKKENFSIVVYKKKNPITQFFKEIEYFFEKIKIMRQTQDLKYLKNKNK